MLYNISNLLRIDRGVFLKHALTEWQRHATSPVAQTKSLITTLEM